MIRQIPMSGPDITSAEIDAVNQVLRTPQLALGPHLVEFEQRFAAYVGTRHALAVSSGTAALHLAVLAAGVRDGDLVLTTPFSFIASANVVLYERAVPVFVDIEAETGNIDPDALALAARDLVGGRAGRWLPPALRERAASGPLRALLPVHAFGHPAELDAVFDVARAYGLPVVEDACEALGAEYRGRRVGTTPAEGRVRVATCFAFYPNKQMTTGEGGMLVTDDDEWEALVRSLRNQGRDVFDAWLNHSRLGYNYRLDEISAALGLAQLGRIDDLLARRLRVTGWYNQRLGRLDGVEVPAVGPHVTRLSWFVYVVRLAPDLDRKAVLEALGARGVPSRPYFTPIHLQPFYRERFGYREGDFPVTEEVARRSLALPFSSVMTEDQVEYVCQALADTIGRRPL
jgi:dTDP-4-amino-4,6-dideoxygalactose transaminase